MHFDKDGSSLVNDEDCEYLDDGRFVYNVDAQRIHHLLHKAIKQAPDFYNTGLFKELLTIHSMKDNYGVCCRTTFVSNQKTCVCNKCGNIVRLT